MENASIMNAKKYKQLYATYDPANKNWYYNKNKGPISYFMGYIFGSITFFLERFFYGTTF